MERFEEATAEILKAREMDPLSPTTFFTLGFVHDLAGKPEQSIEELENYRQIDPNYLPVNLWLGLVYAESSRFEESIALIKSTLPHLPIAKPALAYVYAKARMHTQAQEVLTDLEKSRRDYFETAAIAGIYAELGMQEECALWLEKAYTEGDLQSGFLFTFLPWFNPLRKTYLFQEHTKKISSASSH